MRRIALLLAVLLIPGAVCRGDGPEQALTFDPDVLTGKLQNGLTYYVRQNDKPKGRLEFRLAVRVGSILEDDDQQGLAHFLEHMAFNGTEHFDRQKLVDYLESIGMRFGPELNAYTSFDETVYRLQVPVDNTNAVDTAFQILRDWAFGIRNEDREIEKERGVVIEEWRLGRGAYQRIRDKQYPVLFQGSKYASRLPIGKKEVIESFKPDQLRRFYKDWYRPDLMALIVVGSAKPEAMLEKIKTVFADTKNRQDPRKRPDHEMPDHKDSLVCSVTDPEATWSSVSVHFKLKPAPLATVGDYRRQLVEELFTGMLSERMEELRLKSDPPFLGASASKGRLVLAKDAFTLASQVKDNGFLRGIEAILAEAERVRRFGFTPGELDRTKAKFVTEAEKKQREKLTTESGVYASEYIGCFAHSMVSPGVDAELKMHKDLLPGISVQEVNALAAEWVIPGNRVILASGPEKKGVAMPTNERLLDAFAGAAKADLKPYVDDVGAEGLLEKEPAPGTVASRETIDELGVSIWRLSNGARVLLKPTQFKKDQILFGCFGPGGHSLVPDSDFVSASSADSIVSESGIGRFSEIQLRKKLAGKIVSERATISELRQDIKGSCRPEDLETAMQLLYLHFTPPRKDEEAYGAYRERTRTYLLNRLARPETGFFDEIAVTMYTNNFRRRPWTPETLDALNPDKVLRIYRERFSSANDFVFIFVGNFELKAIEPLVARYVGGLPSSGGAQKWKDLGIRMLKGPVSKTVFRGRDPKSTVQMLYSGDLQWSIPERFRINAMIKVLDIRLREKIREDIGGTYHVNVYPALNHYPVASYEIFIQFGCAPARVEGLIAEIRKEIDSLKTGLVDDLYLTKVKQTLLREREAALERNEFWRNVLDACEWDKEDPRQLVLDFGKRVNALTKEDIRDTAKKYFETENMATFILKPAEDAKPATGAKSGGEK